MKKFLKLCAAFSLVGALFVGCINNDEPAGVKEVRIAKAELLRAKAELIRAQAIVEAARVAEVRANAAYRDAEAALLNARAEYVKMQAEAQKIKNDAEKAKADAEIAVQKAKMEHDIQYWLTQLEIERKNTLIAQYEYLGKIIDLENALRNAKIGALDEITGRMYYLYIERATLTDQLAEQRALKVMYQSASVPRIIATLEYEVEKAQFQYDIVSYYYQIWQEIKGLTLDQYADYLPQMKEEMELAYAKSIDLRLKADEELFTLAELQNAEEAAKWDFDYSGMYAPIIDNVFSTSADDVFAWYKVNNGGTSGGHVDWIATGVVDNTYAFYGRAGTYGSTGDMPLNAKALVGYKSALDILIQDSLLIERSRTIRGLERSTSALNTLNSRKSTMEGTIEDFEDACDEWRDNYDLVQAGPNWNTERGLFTAALATYNARLGEGIKEYKDRSGAALEPFNMIANPGAAASRLGSLLGSSNGTDQAVAARYGALLLALDEPDPNVRTAAIAALPISFLYHVQKEIITDYLKVLQGIMGGTSMTGWKVDAQQELSDVLGGVNFNPAALLSLVWTPHNLEVFEKIVNTILDLAAASDLISMLNAIMPAYYEKTMSYWGYTDEAAGPIMQKYHVTTNLEYHVWFMLYYLLEGPGLSIGGGIFTVGGYASALDQILIDFLGGSLTTYPGTYDFTISLPNQVNSDGNPSSVSITASHRVVTVADFFRTPAQQRALPGIADVLKAENDLRIKWRNWGIAVEDLRDYDEWLYIPYNRAWTVATVTSAAAGADWYNLGWDGGKISKYVPSAPGGATANQPPWYANLAVSTTTANRAQTIALNKTTAAVSRLGFYFRPELTTGAYPSLVDGEDLYWTRNYVPFGAVENWNTIFYYPSIAMRNSALVSVDWNHLKNIGYPFYNSDPVLWTNDWGNDTWENNNNLDTYNEYDKDGKLVEEWDLALTAQAFITIRNYNQFKFWYDENKEHDSYNKLLANITAEIEALRPIVAALHEKWVEATQARLYKEYEIRAMYHEADMYSDHYWRLTKAYDNMANDVITYMWADPYYDLAFTEYQKAESYLAAATTNLQIFKDSGFYFDFSTMSFDDTIFEDWWAEWTKIGSVNNPLHWTDNAIEGLEQRLAVIDAELEILEAQKEAILSLVIDSL